MARLLFLIAFALVVYTVLRRILGAASRRQIVETSHYAPMVACVTCGVHLPQSTAIVREGRHYCSAAHADSATR